MRQKIIDIIIKQYLVGIDEIYPIVTPDDNEPYNEKEIRLLLEQLPDNDIIRVFKSQCCLIYR